MAMTKSGQGTRECCERMGFLTDSPRAMRGLGSLEKEWSQGGELGVLVGSCELHPNFLDSTLHCCQWGCGSQGGCEQIWCTPSGLLEHRVLTFPTNIL